MSVRDGATSNDDDGITYTNANDPQNILHYVFGIRMIYVPPHDTHVNNYLTSAPSMLLTVSDTLEVDSFHAMFP